MWNCETFFSGEPFGLSQHSMGIEFTGMYRNVTKRMENAVCIGIQRLAEEQRDVIHSTIVQSTETGKIY